MISFHGTGLSVAPPINFHEIAAACEDPEEVGYIRIYNAHQSIFSSNYIYVLFFLWWWNLQPLCFKCTFLFLMKKKKMVLADFFFFFFLIIINKYRENKSSTVSDQKEVNLICCAYIVVQNVKEYNCVFTKYHLWRRIAEHPWTYDYNGWKTLKVGYFKNSL